MSSSDMALELEKLRAEVAALRAAKGKAAAESKRPDEAAAESAAPSSDEPRAEEPDDHVPDDHIKGQLEELTDLLEAEIRDLPTITCLAVFTAGILLGRFMR